MEVLLAVARTAPADQGGELICYSVLLDELVEERVKERSEVCASRGILLTFRGIYLSTALAKNPKPDLGIPGCMFLQSSRCFTIPSFVHTFTVV